MTDDFIELPAAEKSGGLRSLENALVKSLEMAEVGGVATGLVALDNMLGGLHPSDLLIIAGRPSMGKTALATNIAFNAAVAALESNKSGALVAFFSLEMSAEQLAIRILATESGVPSNIIRQGEIKAVDVSKIVDVSRRLQAIPLFIDDTPALSVPNLWATALCLKREKGLSLIVIDNLQLVEPNDASRRNNDNRVQEISDITRSLKALAKELNVPVIALSGVSRAVEQRENKRPQLADLSGSASIEQHADVVMFVHREEYYEARMEPAMGTEKHVEWQARMDQVHNQAEIIIAKQRHGPVGTVRLFFNSTLTRFGNLWG